MRSLAYLPDLQFHTLKKKHAVAQIVTYARPSRLFRYRSIDDTTLARELKAIEKGYIFCSSYASLNDPMEGGHRLSAMLSKGRKSQSVSEEVEKAISSMGIASFSEVKNHEAMWAHYSSKFSGICIAYKTTRLISCLPKTIDIVKMNYSEDPPVLLLNSDTPETRAKLSLSYKTLRWSQEREWRIFAPNQGPQHYHNTSTISAVYIGARVTDEIKNKIIQRIGNAGIPVYSMKIDSYQLKFRAVKRKPA